MQTRSTRLFDKRNIDDSEPFEAQANQLGLYFSSLAYTLMEAPRRLALQHGVGRGARRWVIAVLPDSTSRETVLRLALDKPIGQ